MDMSVLVTGGAGFIGSHLTEVLVDNNVTVLETSDRRADNRHRRTTEDQYLRAL
jgi:nucleoside-diphosphate-sugar epimerase